MTVVGRGRRCLASRCVPSMSDESWKYGATIINAYSYLNLRIDDVEIRRPLVCVFDSDSLQRLCKL